MKKIMNDELIEWVHMFYWFFDIYFSSVKKYLSFIKSRFLKCVCPSRIFTFLFSCRISLRDAFKNSNLQVGKKSVQSLSISYLLTFSRRSDWRQFRQIPASEHQNATKSVLESHHVQLGRKRNYADCRTENDSMSHAGLNWDFKDYN